MLVAVKGSESRESPALTLVASREVTGQAPWPDADLLERLSNEPPDPRTIYPGVPDAVAELANRCLAHDPERRFASAAAFSTH